MATNFPSSADSFTNPSPSDSMATVSHADQHTDVNDAVEAIETALLDGAPLHIDDANERVGIGTTSPAGKLHVEFDSGSDGVVLTNTANTVGKQGMRVAFDNDRLTVQRTSDSGVFEANYVAIDQDSGNVGIGTTSPAVPLHVDGDAGNNEIAKLQSSQTSATYSLVGITDANETAKAFIGFNPGASLNNTDSYLMLGMNGDDVNGGNGVIVRKGGSVGIGTNSPTARLDVAGEVQSAHVTLDRNGISDTQPAIDVEYPGSSSAYNYFLRAYNDTNPTAVMFVNGTTRTADGGASTMTIRNDNGPSRFGKSSFATTIEGTSVTMPGQPSFKAILGTGQTYGGSGSINLAFNNVLWNIGNHYNSSTGIFTAPVSGTYVVGASLAQQATGTGFIVIEWLVNGVKTPGGQTIPPNTSASISSIEGGVSTAGTVYLSANDTLQLIAYKSYTGNLGNGGGGVDWGEGRNFFSAALLG
jgi:hypothetical protein